MSGALNSVVGGGGGLLSSIGSVIGGAFGGPLGAMIGVGVGLPPVQWSRCDDCPHRAKCGAVSQPEPATP
mgnify:CR=1 FL=1